MRLYSSKVPGIAEELIRTLAASEKIELASADEVRLDLEAVLKEYVRLERDVTEEAKNRMESRGLGYGNLGRVRSQVAKERGAPPQDDTLPYVVEQLLNMLFHSNNVEEIYAEDAEIRKMITPILRKYMATEDDEVDLEVRSKIKNLQEGTANFEVEYERIMGQVRRRRGQQ